MGGEAGEAPTNGGVGAGEGGAPGAGGVGESGAPGAAGAGEPDPPYTGPTVVELRLAEQHSCARLADRSVQCWGKDVLVHEEESGGSTDSGLIQWPYGPFATEGPEPPDDEFTQVAYGGAFGCGLRSSGAIECWGESEYGATTPPPGTYQLVAAGADHACAFGERTGVRCWGRDGGFQSSPSALVSAWNRGYARVVTAGSGVINDGRWTELPEEGGGEGFRVASNFATACGLRTDGTLDCFGAAVGIGIGIGAKIRVPQKKLLDVAMSERAICGVTEDGVECWGEGIEAAVAGEFVQVSTSWDFTCAVDGRGRLTCWAPLPGGVPLVVPEGTFSRVVVGGTNEYGTNRHVSALRTDGGIVTWIPSAQTGDIVRSLELPGSFTDLAAGYEDTCAVDVSGGYACWTPYSSPEGVGIVPVSDVTRVVVGFNQGCTLRTNGSVSCWGGLGQWDTDDFIFVPGDYPGPFTDLSMGGDYACGVLADGGGIQCWGSHVR